MSATDLLRDKLMLVLSRLNAGRLYRQFVHSEFVHSVVVAVTGTAGAQAVAMVFSPVITRLYGPEIIGVQGTFLALASVVVPVAAFCYPVAVVLPEDDTDACGVVALSVYLALALAALFALLLLVAGDWLVNLLGVEAIGKFVWFLPLTMLLSAWLQAGQQYLIRNKNFDLNAKSDIAKAFAVNGAKVGIGWLEPSTMPLIVLPIVGNAVHACFLFLRTECFSPHSTKTPLTPKSSLFVLAKRYRDFPFYRTPQELINAVSQSIPVLMLASLFGPSAAGFYSIGRSVMGLPANVIGRSVGDVFYAYNARASSKGKSLTRSIIKATLSLAAIGFLPFGLVAAFGPQLFAFAFGNEWAVAGEYARWLSLWLFWGFINRPSVVSVPVLGLQKGLVIYEVFSTLSKIIAIYIGFVVFESDKMAIATFSVFGTLAYIVLITWVVLASMNPRLVRVDETEQTHAAS